jgi:hypothetical protein
MKLKLAILVTALISTGVMAKMVTTKTKGTNAWVVVTKDETTKMTNQEIRDALKKNDLRPQNSMWMDAKAEANRGKVGTIVYLHSFHNICFQNYSSADPLTFSYLFSLSFLEENVHSSEQNVTLPIGVRRCIDHESFMNVTPMKTGVYKIIAWTTGQEGAEVVKVNNIAPLTVVE